MDGGYDAVRIACFACQEGQLAQAALSREEGDTAGIHIVTRRAVDWG
jgi:hypothetical protein